MLFSGQGLLLSTYFRELEKRAERQLKRHHPIQYFSVCGLWVTTVRCQRECKTTADNFGVRYTRPHTCQKSSKVRQEAVGVEGKVRAMCYNSAIYGEVKGDYCSFKDRKVRKHQASLPPQRWAVPISEHLHRHYERNSKSWTQLEGFTQAWCCAPLCVADSNPQISQVVESNNFTSHQQHQQTAG